MLKRPLVRYHGGKWKLASWIISHFPQHRVYVEPFGGAASVLLRKPPSAAEIYNDLDAEMVNLFRMVRDRGADLRFALTHTPFARDEFDLAWEPTEDALERARRTIVRAAMGRDSASATMGRQSTFRLYVGDKRSTTMQDWVNYPEALDAIIWRVRGVAIENRDALKVMADYDGHDVLHYVDPPYVFSTRDATRQDYRHELDDAAHERLLNFLVNLDGMVILSGYGNDLYHDALVGWRKVSRRSFADCAKEREEVLWISPSAANVLGAGLGQAA